MTIQVLGGLRDHLSTLAPRLRTCQTWLRGQIIASSLFASSASASWGATEPRGVRDDAVFRNGIPRDTGHRSVNKRFKPKRSLVLRVHVRRDPELLLGIVVASDIERERTVERGKADADRAHRSVHLSKVITIACTPRVGVDHSSACQALSNAAPPNQEALAAISLADSRARRN